MTNTSNMRVLARLALYNAFTVPTPRMGVFGRVEGRKKAGDAPGAGRRRAPRPTLVQAQPPPGGPTCSSASSPGPASL